MNALKLHRFITALAFLLMVVFCISSLPVSADDSLNAAEPGTDAPAESDGFEPGTIKADLGEWVSLQIETYVIASFLVQKKLPSDKYVRR